MFSCTNRENARTSNVWRLIRPESRLNEGSWHDRFRPVNDMPSLCVEDVTTTSATESARASEGPTNSPDRNLRGTFINLECPRLLLSMFYSRRPRRARNLSEPSPLRYKWSTCDPTSCRSFEWVLYDWGVGMFQYFIRAPVADWSYIDTSISFGVMM